MLDGSDNALNGVPDAGFRVPINALAINVFPFLNNKSQKMFKLDIFLLDSVSRLRYKEYRKVFKTMKAYYRNDILRDFRKQQKLSLRDAEKICGVSKSAIDRAESGASGISIGALVRIAQGYKLPICILFDPKFKLPNLREETGKIIAQTIKDYSHKQEAARA